MSFWKSVVPHDAELRQGSRRFQIGEKSFNGYEHNKLWRGNGDGTFTEMGWVAGSDVIIDCRAVALADFDRDGRQDIVVRTMYERSYFLHNEGDAGRFLHIELVGTKSNRMGIGTRIEAYFDDQKRIGEMVCGSSFLSQHEPAVRFGLGNYDQVDRLVVKWPSGLRQEFRNVPADRFLTITEGNDEPEIRLPAKIDPPERGKNPEVDPFVTLLESGKYRNAAGEEVRGADYRKDVTLLHVWSPGCDACRKEVGVLRKLHEIAEDERFGILAIAVDATPEAVREYVDKHGITYPVLVAEEDTATELKKLPTVPWSLVARGFGGWFEVGSTEPTIQPVPWTGIMDQTGLQRRYRGPIKYFEAKLDILAALGELRKKGESGQKR